MRNILILLILTLGWMNSYAQNFKFALLTDIHITKDTAAYNDLRRSVDQINATDGLSFVLVTGDITEEGDSASLAKAKSVLEKLNLKYYIVSGNHENKWSESGATDFGHIYGSERFRFEQDGILFLGFSTGPVIRMMDGHVPPQDIAWLKEELEKAGKDKPVILATHYPLQEGDVDNWYEVTDAIRPYNIRVVLGGHYHRNIANTYDGIPGLLNRSNLKGNQKVGGYSIYEVRPDSIIVSEQKIGGQPKKWGGYSMTKKYFTEDNSSYKRPDFSINQEFPQVKETWTVTTGKGIYSSPVLYKDNVYVGDDLGFLTCYQLKDGKKRWDFQAGNRIIGTPAADNGVVVFGSADMNIYGINTKTGKLLWKHQAGKAVLGAVTIEKGTAYIGASDNTFYALDVKTGAVRWTFTGVKGYVETRPLLYEDKVIFGSWGNALYALKKSDGTLLWKWDGGLTRMHFSPAAVWPVAADGKVFITDPQRAMTAIDLNSGQTVWRTFQSMVRETIGLSEDKARLYSKTMQDSLVCYSSKGNTPNELWATNVGFGYEHAPSMPQEKDGVVLGSTKNGLIFGLEAQTGKLLWKHKTGNSLISTVVPIGKNRCLFTSTSGIIGLLHY